MKHGQKASTDRCKYCGKEISKSNMRKHIRSHENGNYDNAIQKYQQSYHLNHSDLYCKFCGKEYKNKNSLVQHEIRCNNNPDKINTAGQNNGMYGKSGWNKGLTKETDDRIKNQVHTYKVNEQNGLHKDISGDRNPAKREDVREKISNRCLEKSKNGTWHTSLAKNMHYNYKNEDFHGTWELRYAIYLDNHNIKWKRNKKRFKYIYQHKTHYYTPDFYLIDTDEYIEIKGYIQPNGKDYAKWKFFPKDKKLVILRYNDLMNLGIFNINITEYI